jgi:hypothetical protein
MLTLPQHAGGFLTSDLRHDSTAYACPGISKPERRTEIASFSEPLIGWHRIRLVWTAKLIQVSSLWIAGMYLTQVDIRPLDMNLLG